MKNEKDTRFFAFSPKASKSRLVQAGLLTYPLFNAFPLPELGKQWFNVKKLFRNYSSGNCTGITRSSGSPVSLLIL